MANLILAEKWYNSNFSHLNITKFQAINFHNKRNKASAAANYDPTEQRDNQTKNDAKKTFYYCYYY